ncbi:sulfatase-like hydrolase/transferase [Proteus terrae]|uniref:sulfatase-like hydrolase/transferase n=1 Tax=Proteus terrae TaxID=1574161 RepID=UPI0025B25D51|nr:sulfatase-like hydrolase/transferase [Proteus terrae]
MLKSIVIFSLFMITSFWIVADYFTGEGINDAVIYTLTTSVSNAPFDLDKKYIVLILSALLITVGGIYIARKLKKNNYFFDFLFLLSLILFSVFASPIKNIIDLINIDEFSSNNEKYIVNDEILKSTKGNYIFIIAESLERTFMDIDGNNYLEKISSLENKIDFSNIGYVPGTGWTMAGHVGFICGVPLTGTGNDASKLNTFLPKATCFTDLTKKDGYKNIYISGTNLEFAGMRNFLKTHSFDDIIERRSFDEKNIDKESVNRWGLDDQIVFDKAIDVFNNESKKDNKFSLYVSTINTHNPGFPSPSCKNEDEFSYLDSVKCADKMIYEFIKKIQESEYYKNTTIVLISDHGLMGWDTLVGVKTERRNLFLVFNEKLKNEEIKTKGIVLDQLPTALEVLSGRKVSLGFGRGIYKEESSLLSLEPNDINYARSLWAFPTLDTARYHENGKLVIGGIPFKLPICIQYNDKMEIITFSEGGEKSSCRKEIDRKGTGNYFLATKCGDKMCSEIYESEFNIMRKTESGYPFENK